MSNTGKKQQVTQDTSPRLNGHILIVEDNETCQILLKGLLKSMGLSFELAVNGKQALELLGRSSLIEKTFDIILMDCEMPLMGGIEATDFIRRNGVGPYREIPIIAVTSKLEDNNENLCYDAGMNGFVNKPVNLTKLQPFLVQFLSS